MTGLISPQPWDFFFVWTVNLETWVYVVWKHVFSVDKLATVCSKFRPARPDRAKQKKNTGNAYESDSSSAAARRLMVSLLQSADHRAGVGDGRTQHSNAQAKSFISTDLAPEYDPQIDHISPHLQYACSLAASKFQHFLPAREREVDLQVLPPWGSGSRRARRWRRGRSRRWSWTRPSAVRSAATPGAWSARSTSSSGSPRPSASCARRSTPPRRTPSPSPSTSTASGSTSARRPTKDSSSGRTTSYGSGRRRGVSEGSRLYCPSVLVSGRDQVALPQACCLIRPSS